MGGNNMDRHKKKRSPLNASSRADLLLEQTESLAKVGYWELDLETQQLQWSDGVFRLAGYEPGEIEVNFESAVNVIHPDDREMAFEMMNKTVTTGVDYAIQKRFITKDGHIKHIRSVAKRIDDENGKPSKLVGIFHDITDIVKSKYGINDERFKVLAEQGADLTAIVNMNGEIVYLSPTYKSVLGYDEADLLGKNAFEYMHPDEMAIILHEFEELKLKRRVESSNYRFKHKDGSWVWIRSVGTNLADDQGVAGFLINSVDLTSIIEIQEKLKRNNELFEYLNRASNNAIYDWNVQEDVYAWGDGFYRMFGYDRSDKPFTMADWIELEHPSEREKYHKLWTDFFSDPQKSIWNYETRIRKADGSYIYVEEVGHLIRNSQGKPVRMIGVLRDLSTTKELQRLLDTASRLAQVGAWELDMQANRLIWSEMSKEILEVPVDHEPEFATISSFFKVGHSRDLRTESIKRAMSDGTPYDITVQVITAKGNEKWIRSIGQPEIEDGNVVRIYGSFQDVTKMKLFEQSLLDLNKQLEISNSELEQFAYVASHDLQEPLRMVSSFLTLLEKKYGDVFDDKARQYIHYARDGAVRMRQIILDLLDFSRVGKHTDTLKPVNLNNIMKDVIALHRKLIDDKSAIIHVEELPTIKSYQTPLLQVFHNLVGNALKYTRTGESSVIRISSKELDDRWELTVADNGIGIDPQQHERIFVIFQRLHRRDEYTGTGMGLAIVRKILDDLGGQIWVESELGKGSSFIFSLPKIKE